MNEYGCKMKEEIKATQSEIKKNTQGTNSDEKETGTQIKDWNRRNKHSTRTERRNKNSKK